MKATGMVRNIDALGRIVVPKEIRASNGIENGDPVEIFVSEDGIVLRPLKLQCVDCGNRDEERHIVHRGVHLCPVCYKAFERTEKGATL